MNRKKRIAVMLAAIMISVMTTFTFFGTSGFSAAAEGTFEPRLSTPSYDNEYYFSNKNIFYSSGYGMPNCTAYAYGRAYEILGSRPSLPTYDARRWYELTTAYEKGQEPRLGAIAVWWSSSAGHVAVVEKIENGVVTFSNSSWNGRMFYLTTGKADGSDNFGGNSSWDFLGFIYLLDEDVEELPPIDGGGSESNTVPPIGEIGENQVMRVRLNVSSLAVRSDHSTNASALDYITTPPQGAYYFVTELYTDTRYCWGKINYNGKDAWIALSTWAENTGCFYYGDVDMDGSVTIIDATKIQRVLAGIDNDKINELYDVNRDGNVNITDCAKIQQIVAGI